MSIFVGGRKPTQRGRYLPEQYTDRARKALIEARAEAARAGRREIGSEFILYAVLSVDGSGRRHSQSLR